MRTSLPISGRSARKTKASASRPASSVIAKPSDATTARATSRGERAGPVGIAARLGSATSDGGSPIRNSSSGPSRPKAMRSPLLIVTLSTLVPRWKTPFAERLSLRTSSSPTFVIVAWKAASGRSGTWISAASTRPT
jgi:hypothetical protein